MHFRLPGSGLLSRPFSYLPLTVLLLGLTGPGIARAQFAANADAATAAREQHRQDQRIEALRRQQERSTDVRLGPQQAADADRLADEAPCFAIDRLTIKGDDAGDFRWLDKAAAGPAGDDPPQGRCLGGQGVNLILKRLQNALIARGYITTRIAAEPQDLKGGELVLLLTPGRIDDIRLTPESTASVSLRAAIPARKGDILDLRDIEQGLENLRTLPSADAGMKIAPAAEAGRSDLLVTYRQGFPLRSTLAVDDSGTKATGKYQGSATVAWDNPAHLNDLLYLTLNHDLGGAGGRGTDGGVLHYSVPFGYWQASFTYDRSSNHQTIAGAFQDYIYRGRNTNTELKLARVVHRDGVSKTTVAVGAFQRSANNYIDDTEVEVQRRRTAGWLASLAHRRFIGAAVVDGRLGYKRGTGAFGAITAPEEAFGEGTSRFSIVTADLAFSTPFTLAEKPFQYSLNWRAQHNRTPLAPPERFSIGGRYTVRGFDGETILMAERGWLLRNEVSTGIVAGIEGYAGLDYGEVGGPSADLLIGKRLAGAVLGVRGGWKGLRYDVFVGAPVYKPEGLRTASTTSGFNLSYNF